MTREERLIRAIWQEEDKEIILTKQGEEEILSQILTTSTTSVTPKVPLNKTRTMNTKDNVVKK